MARVTATTTFGPVLRRPLLLIIHLLLLRAAPSAARCDYNFTVQCEPDFTVGTTLQIKADDPNGSGQEVYRARVKFYFDGMVVRGPFFRPTCLPQLFSLSNRFLPCLLMLRSRTLCLIRKTIHFRKEDIGNKTYPIGELSVIESKLYQFDDTPDKRVIGIQVKFVDAPTCAGRAFDDYLEVTYSGTSCGVGEEATKNPTQEPTTARPTTARPTRIPTGLPTGLPTGPPTARPTTLRPATAKPTTSATKNPTTKLGFDEKVRSSMILYHSEVMDTAAVEIWTDTTEETVLRETVKIVNNHAADLGYYPQGYREEDVKVTVTLIDQLPGEQVRQRGLLGGGRRAGRRRVLQDSTTTAGLNIDYDTRIVVPVPYDFFGGGKAASDAAEWMAYSAFSTTEGRKLYASDLRVVGSASGDFQLVRTVEVFDEQGGT
ncbi:hypothetical protein THAOC_01832, partial [Thalassiosira oceanica]